jgi:DNA-binding NarL/FixJ family response regulator
MALWAQLADFRGLALATATGLINLWLGVAFLQALAAAILVLAVKVILGLLWPKPVFHPAAAQSSRLPGPGLLSPAEAEIAAMVGTGLKNRQIAALLYKSERTVDNQVHSILNKLSLENRSQIAVWANQHGLIYQKPDQRPGPPM